ncbi:MAG: hypothetical protein HY700_05985 [Gemmatimonadetes bacterium]|nr:hypothetical protein [Gemmatimonadota bacterium]
MKAVFIGGSRKVARLNERIRQRLGAIIERELRVYMGDAPGADKAVQQFFADRHYEHVIVYCVEGRYRNNVGHWPIRPVEPPPQARGFEYYASKDIQMAADASFGMMLWDGNSRGTLANIRNLLAHGKPVAVYLSPRREFQDLKRESDLDQLLSSVAGKDGESESRVAPHQAEVPPGRRRRRKSTAGSSPTVRSSESKQIAELQEETVAGPREIAEAE